MRGSISCDVPVRSVWNQLWEYRYNQSHVKTAKPNGDVSVLKWANLRVV